MIIHQQDHEGKICQEGAGGSQDVPNLLKLLVGEFKIKPQQAVEKLLMNYFDFIIIP
jgi:hypothetical protein